MHAHFVPPRFAEVLTRGNVLSAGLPIPEWVPERQLAAMDDAGIDVAVLSASDPGATWGAPAFRREMARIINEGARDAIDAHAGRFRALATLPLPDPEAALEELAYALDELALDGVLLPSSVDGIYPGDRRWDELFDELERRRAYVFIHPSNPVTGASLDRLDTWVVDWPFETTRAAANLIFSGTIVRCPNVRIQLAHGGGTIPFLAHRLAWQEDYGDWSEVIPDGALAAVRHFYYDTAMAHFPPAMNALLAAVDPARIVFGTDYPYVFEDRDALGRPQAYLSELGDETRRRIDGANALALVAIATDIRT